MIKKRISKSELDFYLYKLRVNGWRVVTKEVLLRHVKYTLQKGDSIKVVTFTANSWVLIN